MLGKPVDNDQRENNKRRRCRLMSETRRTCYEHEQNQVRDKQNTLTHGEKRSYMKER